MSETEEQKIINNLTANWIWIPHWIDAPPRNEDTAGRIVEFTRRFNTPTFPTRALLHFSADTRYKLFVNGKRVAVGPCRGSLVTWFYDTLDIAPYLNIGVNDIVFIVVRYFAASRLAVAFERTAFPGLTVVGTVEVVDEVLDVGTSEGWEARVLDNIRFPTGLVDDGFLHINERISTKPTGPIITPELYGIKTLNGDLAPWRLRPRAIPVPEETPCIINTIRACESNVPIHQWTQSLQSNSTLLLAGNSSHKLELQADVHLTAFLKLTFRATEQTYIRIKITYSEGYELEPPSYPFFRKKWDRLDAVHGRLIGPYDEVTLDFPRSAVQAYEPFWLRTFRVLRLEILVGTNPVEFVSLEATQVNYPLELKSTWREPGNKESEKIWDVSVRTLRNCMFDGYSDCPFYEQLQYSGDSRQVGLFHYLISGDDRLMRQTISSFSSSVTPEGLTQSRFPSHTPQIIAGFSLYWILQVCDHHLFFGDTRFARSFLPRIDGVLAFFDAHVDELGLISGLPYDVWQYVDWVEAWGATEKHLDKGVPTSGRDTNRHTYFSMLYAYVLKQAARLVRDVNRPAHAVEYEARAMSILQAIRKHCYDGVFFTDSTADLASESAYSQHCQIFAVLSGAACPAECGRILDQSMDDSRFSKCSYMMRFYAFRALAEAGDDTYESHWPKMWDPWRKMLANNLTTWEEDDVRQRSDCHAWGSVPLYEYCTELAGLRPAAPGWKKLLFKPRLALSEEIRCNVALGKENVATVSWSTPEAGTRAIALLLTQTTEVYSKLPGCEEICHGMIDNLRLVYHDTLAE